MHWDPWPPYVPVAERRARARRAMNRLRKQGRTIEPVTIEGRRITHTFWGDAWCEHLMGFASLANRLERGRTYVRNGSVCHLEIDTGTVRALVMGNELYQVELGVKPLAKARWAAIRRRCAGDVGSLMDLLQGRLSAAVMGVVTDRDAGLFPAPQEFRPQCSCPDYVDVCKHVAAVFYAVGARLDTRPELLFRLRGVDHLALVDDDADAVAALTARGGGARLDEADLADVFGIELAGDEDAQAPGGDTATTRGRGTRARRAAGAGRGGKARGRKARPRAAPAGRAEPVAGGGRGTSLPDPVEARHVRALRERLGISRAELARLLDMSAAAVGVWERRVEPLALQPASRDALERVWRMSRAAARRALRRR